MPLCPTHNLEMKLVPGGVSKNRKPYQAFWSCPLSREQCGYTENVTQAPPAVVPMPRTPGPVSVVAGSMGSLKLQAACAAVQAVASLRAGSGAPLYSFLDEAAAVYHKFLKPSVTDDVPEGFGPDPDIPF